MGHSANASPSQLPAASVEPLANSSGHPLADHLAPQAATQSSTQSAIAQFRDLLKKVGSGTHTSKSLTRQEAAIATHLMLTEAATPAQIGAFMIAHRIKRPTPTELAGMLDTYDALGPRLTAIESPYPVTVFCNPYDGRSRTAPITPLTALILAAADAPVVMPGSGRMPTKMGLPSIEIFQGLGLNWAKLSLAQVQTVLAKTGLALVYQPVHFPQAQAMVPYREQIGKRPTLATVEIMWSPYTGRSHVVSGYVHPPTEGRTQEAFTVRQVPFFTTVKGLEGSCDISRDRTGIICLNQLKAGCLQAERLLLHPHDYGFQGPDPAFMPLPDLLDQYQKALAGEMNEISRSAIWNSGFYLWRVGRVDSLETGFALAKDCLAGGAVRFKVDEIEGVMDQSKS
jgi:anthranilate phosphoribosyltransferase